MSINLATGGMFNNCCGTGFTGGAPPYRPYKEESVAPLVLVKKVEIKTINTNESISSYIKIMKVNDGGNL